MSKLATFRINENIWEQFKRWCTKRGSNASQELSDYVCRCIDNIDGIDGANNIDNLYTPIQDVNKRLNELEDRLNQVCEEVSRLSCFYKPSLNCIDTVTDHAQNNYTEEIVKFKSLSLGEKRKKINELSKQFSSIKQAIREVLVQRNKPPKRISYNQLNTKECVTIYSKFSGNLNSKNAN